MPRGPSLCAAAIVAGMIGVARADPPPSSPPSPAPVPTPSPTPAPAPTMDACAQVYEGAQQLIRAGALLRSRAQLSTCESTCPAALARDCEAWHLDLERQIPSLRVSAKVADGSDPGVVRVLVDGTPVVEPREGALIDVDPGKHMLTFESAARARVDVMVDVPLGRKGYAVDVRFPAGPTRDVVPSPRPLPLPRSPGVAPFVLGGVGLAALSAGVVLGVKGQLDRTHLVDTCAPHCPQASVNAISQEWIVGGVVGVAGGALALAGIAWGALEGRSPAPPLVPPPAPPAVVVGVGPRSIRVFGRF
jgi:hypothetical protein